MRPSPLGASSFGETQVAEPVEVEGKDAGEIRGMIARYPENTTPPSVRMRIFTVR